MTRPWHTMNKDLSAEPSRTMTSSVKYTLGSKCATIHCKNLTEHCLNKSHEAKSQAPGDLTPSSPRESPPLMLPLLGRLAIGTWMEEALGVARIARAEDGVETVAKTFTGVPRSIEKRRFSDGNASRALRKSPRMSAVSSTVHLHSTVYVGLKASLVSARMFKPCPLGQGRMSMPAIDMRASPLSMTNIVLLDKSLLQRRWPTMQ
mmetsp:Transcript_93867/g.271333  ORF Transcript_93867/g.271333 Transcript_93867/m.271333 type:complete len:205 (-) Transcript_93867:76-690(-)